MQIEGHKYHVFYLWSPTLVCIWHGPIIAISNSANQLQPGQQQLSDDVRSAK